MTIQRIELRGERYVILPEKDFLALQQKLPASEAVEEASANTPQDPRPRFRKVTPLKVGGPPASELLIQDRR